MTRGPLKLDDADFWADPRRTRSEVAEPYVDAGREALLYDAPQVVPIDVRDTVPTQALRIATFRTQRERPFSDSAIVVVADVVNNVVVADLAVEPSPREREPERPSSAPLLEGMASETYTVELRSRVALPWETGRYVARLIVADQVSEPRAIELTAPVTDPEVEKYKADARNRTAVPALAPPPVEPFAVYRHDDKSPPLPEGLGIRLQLPRVCVLAAGNGCVLRGTFRLPVLRRHIVPPGPPRPGTEALRAQLAAETARGQSLPTAVVPITLVGTGSASPVPTTWRLVVPIYLSLDLGNDPPRGVGTFAIDLRRLQGFDTVEQTWHLYAFSDALMAGPMSVGLTRRPRTP